MATTAKPPLGSDADRIDPHVLKIAVTIVIGALAVVFDSTILSVAINDLGRDLHAPLSTIQWVSTGYLLALAITMPVMRLGAIRAGRQAPVDPVAGPVPDRLDTERLGLERAEPHRLSRRAGHRRRVHDDPHRDPDHAGHAAVAISAS